MIRPRRRSFSTWTARSSIAFTSMYWRGMKLSRKWVFRLPCGVLLAHLDEVGVRIRD